jgi:hypothetical protein
VRIDIRVDRAKFASLPSSRGRFPSILRLFAGHKTSTIYPFDTHFRVSILRLARFATIKRLRKHKQRKLPPRNNIKGGQP